MEKNKDSQDAKSNDFGGFTVSSSRVPDYAKPNIASIVTTKTVTKDLVSRQRYHLITGYYSYTKSMPIPIFSVFNVNNVLLGNWEEP